MIAGPLLEQHQLFFSVTCATRKYLAVELFMNYPNWIPATEQVPAKAKESARSEWMLVVMGVAQPRVDLAAYDHIRHAWVGYNYKGVIGAYDEDLITHWLPLPPMPVPIPSNEIAGFFRTLEPSYEPGVTSMRALFQAVDPNDKALQVYISNTISYVGLQETPIRTRGTMKGQQYFVDFAVYDAVQLRDIKASLDRLNVEYTIAARHKKIARPR